jgi:hypothetical protein
MFNGGFMVNVNTRTAIAPKIPYLEVIPCATTMSLLIAAGTKCPNGHLSAANTIHLADDFEPIIYKRVSEMLHSFVTGLVSSS